MRTILQDVRYGMRMLVRTPVVSLVAMLSLALGIAAASAMFAVASGFLLEPLPFGKQEGLVLIQQIRPGDQVEFAAGVSAPNYRDLQPTTTTLSGLAIYDTENVNVTGLDQPERINIVTGTPNLFDVLSMQPWMGRAFRPDEGVSGSNRVLVVTHAYWKGRFQSDPNILGRTLQIDGQAHEIVGVLPESFEMLPADVRAFRPTDFATDDRREFPGFNMFGRLRPGATLTQARDELTGAFERLRSEFPDANRTWTLLVQPGKAVFPGPTDIKMITLLLTVSLFGVLIACANVANLLLARAEMRMKEMAVRTALGARRGRILRQLLTESLVLALAAGAVGAAMSTWLVRLLQNAMPPILPSSFWPRIDSPTLIATVIVAVLTGIIFGLAPALHATGGSLREVLGEGTRGGTSTRKRKRIRNMFVIGEIAVALALLTGAGFLLQAMNALVNADPGYETAGLITFQLTLPEYRYESNADLVRFQQETIRVLGENPQVSGVALMTTVPRDMRSSSTRFHVEGSPPVEPNDRPATGWQSVNPAYFSTFDIPLVAGRLIEPGDRADTRAVIVVSQTMADEWLGGPSAAIGRRIEIFNEPREVVGVVNDILWERVPISGRGMRAVYVPAAQRPLRNPTIALRSGSPASVVAAGIRRGIATIDPDQPVANIISLEESIRQSLAAPRAMCYFVLALGVLAMILAGIGIYGVMSHSVVQTRREIGIRMAMGARVGQVVGMVTLRGLALTGIGLGIGVPLALLVRRAVSMSLNIFEVQLSASYALVAATVLVMVGILACWLPARRAAQVTPVNALQAE